MYPRRPATFDEFERSEKKLKKSKGWRLGGVLVAKVATYYAIAVVPNRICTAILRVEGTVLNNPSKDKRNGSRCQTRGPFLHSFHRPRCQPVVNKLLKPQESHQHGQDHDDDTCVYDFPGRVVRAFEPEQRGRDGRQLGAWHI
jgi:hypothetical protein